MSCFQRKRACKCRKRRERHTFYTLCVVIVDVVSDHYFESFCVGLQRSEIFTPFTFGLIRCLLHFIVHQIYSCARVFCCVNLKGRVVHFTGAGELGEKLELLPCPIFPFFTYLQNFVYLIPQAKKIVLISHECISIQDGRKV